MAILPLPRKRRDGCGLGARLLLAAVFLTLPAGLAAGAEPDDDADLLPRSVYVPVRFEVAPCLREVVIRTEDGAVRAVAPGRLVSQFTFHPGREGASPAWERLTVEGRIASDAEGEAPRRFRTAIVITPSSIYLGRKRLDLGLEDRVGRFRQRTDLRVPERTVRLRPAGACSGADAGEPVRTAARLPLPSAGR